MVTTAGSTPIALEREAGRGRAGSRSGRTATVVSVSTARTSIWTETTSGRPRARPVPTGCPSMSTGVSGDRLVARRCPTRGCSTSATARSTWLTTDAGPRTSAVPRALRPASPISRPSGTFRGRPRRGPRERRRDPPRRGRSPARPSTISTPSFRRRDLAAAAAAARAPGPCRRRRGRRVTAKCLGGDARRLVVDNRYSMSTTPELPCQQEHVARGCSPARLGTWIERSVNEPEKTSPV